MPFRDWLGGVLVGGTFPFVPHGLLPMLPYPPPLVILMGSVGRAVAPAADGILSTKDESCRGRRGMRMDVTELAGLSVRELFRR